MKKSINVISMPVFTANTLAESTNFGGGRINKTNNAYDINYFITDHLGSTRVIVDANGTIKAQYNYYPFGKQWEDINLMANTNRYTFSGKEKQTIKDLGYLDFGARMLRTEIDPTGWMSIDPLCEKYYSISPYAYCANNPLRYIDPNGMSATDYYNLNAQLVKHIDDNLNDKKLVLTTSKKESDINKAISDDNVVDVPSNNVVSAMNTAYNNTENSGNENAFIVGQEGKISKVVEGTQGEISQENWAEARDDLRAQGDKIAYDVHTHPLVKNESGDIIGYGKAEPSITDKNNTVGNQPNVVLGYKHEYGNLPSNQIGGTLPNVYTRQIGFYNKNGSIVDISFTKFTNTVNKINKLNKK
jgi:RHS repeat-associated protein